MIYTLLPPLLFPSVSDFIRIDNQTIYTGNYAELELNKKFSGNRFILPGPNKIHAFSIPLVKDSFKSGKLSGLKIARDVKWLRELKHAMKTTYGKTPFFEFYDYKLWKAFDESNSDNYLQLMENIFNWAANALEWNIQNMVLSNDELIILKEENRQINRKYTQAFDIFLGFVPHAPVFDLIFNLGPNSGLYLES